MRKLCDGCSHQTDNDSGGVQCGAASYSSGSDGYGRHKQGASCLFDDSLSDLYEPRTGNEIDVRNMASQIERQSRELSTARDQISVLQHRLITVEKQP